MTTMKTLLVCTVAWLACWLSTGTISVKRTINELDMAELKIDLSGCKSTDQYGCKEFTTEWGKNLTGRVHAKLKNDLEEGSHFVASMHIKTGILPVPFTLQCKLCGAPCGFKIPVLEKEISIPLPKCPIKAGTADKAFNVMIPSNDPIPLNIGVDGIVNVYDASGKEVAAAHFSARESKPGVVLASASALEL